MARERALSRDGSYDGVPGSCKDDEEGVSLRVDLSSTRLGEGGAQQLLVCDVHLAVALAERSHESRRAVYIAEQECDSPSGQVLALGGLHTHRDTAAMLGDCTVVVGTLASDAVEGGKLNAVSAPAISAATKMERRRIILPSLLRDVLGSRGLPTKVRSATAIVVGLSPEVREIQGNPGGSAARGVGRFPHADDRAHRR
jgi:hypothetical protein